MEAPESETVPCPVLPCHTRSARHIAWYPRSGDILQGVDDPAILIDIARRIDWHHDNGRSVALIELGRLECDLLRRAGADLDAAVPADSGAGGSLWGVPLRAIDAESVLRVIAAG